MTYSEEEEQEEEEELYRVVMRSEHECAACGDSILYSDETIVLTVVVPTFDEIGALTYVPAEADDGDFLYEPRFFEYVCWEDSVEELYNEVRDLPPVEDASAVAVCKICESGICLNELMGLSTKGELLCSPRSPDGVQTTTFDVQDLSPDAICIACLRYLSSNLVDLWESIDQNGECEEGTTARCWRHGCSGSDDCILKFK